MAYVVGKYEADYADLFHRGLVTIPDQVSDEFLYSRFAYCIVNQYRSNKFTQFALPNPVAIQEARELRLKEEAAHAAADKTDTSERDTDISFTGM